MAGADTTYSVQAGTQASGTTAFTGVGQPSSTYINRAFFRDSNGLTFTCTSTRLSGSVTLGPNVSRLALMKVSSGSFNECTGTAPVTLQITAELTWRINFAGPTMAGVTRAAIANVRIDAIGTGCKFTATGSLDAAFRNSTTTLEIAPVAGSARALTITDVDSTRACFGAYNEGETLALTASYLLSTPPGAITIVSA